MSTTQTTKGRITQSEGDEGKIVFSAGDTEPDLWMRDNYGDQRVELDREDARAFKAAAESKGFKIEPL